MKAIFYAIAICLMSACSKDQDTAGTASVFADIIHDQTDTMMLRLQADPILSLYRFPEDMNTEAFFRLVSITDKRLNPTVGYHLADGITTEKQNERDEVDFRERLVQTFYKKVRSTLANASTGIGRPQTLPHSECFATIAGELQLLAKHHATKKILLVFSDLQENGFFSCYTPAGKKLLEDPQKAANLFQKAYPLPETLTGIKVIFLYQPQTREQDQAFMQMLEVYKLLLIPRGAEVIVQASSDQLL